MVFGDAVRGAADASEAAWIGSALSAARGTVGALVPPGFERCLRIDGTWHDPAAIAALAAVGAGHTSTPEAGWFAVWEGYGFTGGQRLLAVHGRGLVGRLRYRRAARRAERQDAITNEVAATGLGGLPQFDLPIRRYYLVTGPVDAAARLEHPVHRFIPQLPDLWWPQDRAWFVGSDTDIEWSYAAGSSAFTDAVAAALPGRTSTVSPADPIV